MSRRRPMFQVYEDREEEVKRPFRMPNLTNVTRRPVPPRSARALFQEPLPNMPFVTRRSTERVKRLQRENARLKAENKAMLKGFKKLLASIKTYSPKR